MFLVLHADDFGMNLAVTDGILRGFRDGLLTSASLLANAPDAARAIRLWKSLEADRAAGDLSSARARTSLGEPNRPFDLGVHLDLTQGRPLSDRFPEELLDAEGRFPGVFSLFGRLVRLRGRFADAIREEWSRQIQFVCDHGLRPTHLNGHQYAEMFPGVAPVVFSLLERFGIRTIRLAHEPKLFRNTVLHGFHPAQWALAEVKHWFASRFQRKLDRRGIACADAFFGTAHAGHIDLALMRRFLASSRKFRLVEIALHPGEAREPESPQERINGWRDPLADVRPAELEMLVSDALPRLLAASGTQLGRLAA